MFPCDSRLSPLIPRHAIIDFSFLPSTTSFPFHTYLHTRLTCISQNKQHTNIPFKHQFPLTCGLIHHSRHHSSFLKTQTTTCYACNTSRDNFIPFHAHIDTNTSCNIIPYKHEGMHLYNNDKQPKIRAHLRKTIKSPKHAKHHMFSHFKTSNSLPSIVSTHGKSTPKTHSPCQNPSECLFELPFQDLVL